MKKSFLLLSALALMLAGCTADGQRRFSIEEKETIRRTLAFSSGGGTKVLEANNVQGSIRVTGHDGRDVEMIANKTIRAQSQDRMQRAKSEVNLHISDKSDTVNIYVDQ